MEFKIIGIKVNYLEQYR